MRISMWKLLRGKFEYDLFCSHVLQDEYSVLSSFNVTEPESYPCLVRGIYLDSNIVDVVYVYVDDASMLITICNNGGMLG